MKLYYPAKIEDVWHFSADGATKYRLDGIEKLVRLKYELEKDPRFELVEVNSGTPDLLELTHDQEYVQALLSGVPRELAQSSGLLWQESLLVAFANSAKALVDAAMGTLHSGRSGVISKGGHHAVRDRGFGFDPVNEIAICVEKLHQDNPGLKIAVIDLDVHMGNGLQQLLANKTNALLLDIWNKSLDKWGAPIEASNILSYQVKTTPEYWALLQTGLEQVKDFHPDLIIYHSGMDVYSGDRLGGIVGFDEESIRQREELIFDTFPKGVVLVLGGGYVDRSDPALAEAKMRKLIDLHLISFELLWGR